MAGRARQQAGDVAQRHLPAAQAQVGVDRQPAVGLWRYGRLQHDVLVHRHVDAEDVVAHRTGDVVAADGHRPLRATARLEQPAFETQVDIGAPFPGHQRHHHATTRTDGDVQASGPSTQLHVDAGLEQLVDAGRLFASMPVDGEPCLQRRFAQHFLTIPGQPRAGELHDRGHQFHRPAAQLLVETHLAASRAKQFEPVEVDPPDRVAGDTVELQFPAAVAGRRWRQFPGNAMDPTAHLVRTHLGNMQAPRQQGQQCNASFDTVRLRLPADVP
ncbi:MAG: hypothetical protein NVV67_00915 [Pseudoxanthomonas sp.]|nr:hypothetical protein [Pseudoxanthomonas sp.]